MTVARAAGCRRIDLDRLGLDSSALPQLLDAAQHMGFTGLNISFPCKQAIIPLLDELSPEARGVMDRSCYACI